MCGFQNMFSSRRCHSCISSYLGSTVLRYCTVGLTEALPLVLWLVSMRKICKVRKCTHARLFVSYLLVPYSELRYLVPYHQVCRVPDFIQYCTVDMKLVPALHPWCACMQSAARGRGPKGRLQSLPVNLVRYRDSPASLSHQHRCRH